MVLAHGKMLIVAYVLETTTILVYQPLRPRTGKVEHDNKTHNNHNSNNNSSNNSSSEEVWCQLSAETIWGDFDDLDVQENKLAISCLSTQDSAACVKLYGLNSERGLSKVPYRTIHHPSHPGRFARVTLATSVVVTQRYQRGCRSGAFLASEDLRILEMWPADPGCEGDLPCLHRIELPSAVGVRHIFCQPADAKVRLEVLEQVLLEGGRHLAEPDIPAVIPADLANNNNKQTTSTYKLDPAEAAAPAQQQCREIPTSSRAL
ncbi:unnamed protein product, partial [Polarella glacialis]